jgi:hypothetical protein
VSGSALLNIPWPSCSLWRWLQALFWLVRAIMLSAGDVDGKRLIVQTAVTWSAIAIYVLFVSEALPGPVYEIFRSLVG